MEAIDLLSPETRQLGDVTLAVGHTIHLKGRKGVFRIVDFKGEQQMALTCYNWQLLRNFPGVEVTKTFLLDDFDGFEELPKWIQHTLNIA